MTFVDFACYKIFTKSKKLQQFHLENKGQASRSIKRKTGNVRIYTADFLISATQQNVYAKLHTHTHTHTQPAGDSDDDYRQKLPSRFA